MKAFHIARTLLAMALLATLAPTAGRASRDEGAQASYVRICKNSRGSADRRACHSHDAARTAVALND